jgi:hypothetical protein
VLILAGLLTRLAAIPVIVDMPGALLITKLPIVWGNASLFKNKSGWWDFIHEARVDLAQLCGSLSRSKTRLHAVSWGFVAEPGWGWGYAGVVLSLVYRLIRSLLGFLAVVARSDVSKDAELLVLRQENQVLRRQVRGRPRWDDADRDGPASVRRSRF